MRESENIIPRIEALTDAQFNILVKTIEKFERINDNPIHGMVGTRVYRIWGKMKERCYNRNHDAYKNYGGRGITVCDEWQRFKPFCEWAMANGYADNLTLDRKDNDKGYSPENCRWVTMNEQENNRRNNRIITFHGESLTVSQWAERNSISPSTLYSRIYIYGWDFERAISTPPRTKIEKGT